MKKLFVVIVLLLGFGISNVFSSTKNDTVPQQHNSNGGINVYVGYGVGTIYTFTNKVGHDYTVSGKDFTNVGSYGAFLIGFDGNVSKVVSIGFDFSYVPLNYTGIKEDTTTTLYYKDNVLSGAVKLQFNYINKPIVRAYSGISLGISYIFSSVTDKGDINESVKTIRPAGQLTLMGIRVGKQLCGFGEFGFGTNGIIVVGLNYRFK